MGELVRLQRYLASAGVAARRKAEELITAGRVTVNGVVVTTLGTKVDPDTAEVTVDGEGVMAHDKFYVLLNKPKACITAVTDDRGRPTVMDYLLNVPVPVKPVGRLDFYSEGVLLLTNDGELAAKLLAPASHVAKTYHVKVHGQLSNDQVKQLREGITLDDGTETMPAEIEVLPGESKHTWLAITIHEGKHRQIHRMIEALGYAVDKLQRVAFANLTFHNLRVGDARELQQMELNQLRDLVGLDHSSVARGRWRSEREETDIPRRARAKARDEAEAEAIENEENRLRNAAARAAAGGDAWDGEGDPDADPEGDAKADERFLGDDDDDQRGAPLPHVAPAAPPPRPRGKGKPYESRAVGRRDPDDPRAARGGPRDRDERPAPRGSSDHGAPRTGGGFRGGAGGAERGSSTRADGGGFRGNAGGADRGGPRSSARSDGGFRGNAGASDRGPRGASARSDGGSSARSGGGGFRGNAGGADRGGPRSSARGEGGFRGNAGGSDRGTARGASRALPSGQREVRQYSARPGVRRDDAAGSAAAPRGRSDGPPTGARSYAAASDGPRRGTRNDGDAPRTGARSYAAPTESPRREPRGDGDAPRGGGRTFAPRGGAGAGAGRSFKPRDGGDGPRRSPRGDGDARRGGGRTFAPRGDGPRTRGGGDAPRGDGRTFAPRGGAGAGRTFKPREGAAAGAAPARDKGRWRDRDSGPRSRDEAEFGVQAADQKPRGRGARAPGPGGARGQGRSFGKKSDKRR